MINPSLCLLYIRRAFARISVIDIPDDSSIQSGAFFNSFATVLRFDSSDRGINPLRNFVISTPDRLHNKRIASCSEDISRLKNKVGTGLLDFDMTAFSAILSARLVLPMDGRAARTIISLGRNPNVSLSRSMNPDATPVISFLC